MNEEFDDRVVLEALWRVRVAPALGDLSATTAMIGSNLRRIGDNFRRMEDQLRQGSETVDHLVRGLTADNLLEVLKPRLQEVALDTFLGDHARFHKWQFQEEGKNFEVDSGVLDPSTSVFIDRAQIGEALGNLIYNAREHGGEMCVLSASRSNKDATLILVVSDNGQSVDTGFIESVFDPSVSPFRFVTQAADRRGVGLGIARALIEGHGGRLTMEVGTILPGANFKIELYNAFKIT